MSEPQTYKNHGRLYPPFHFFVLPVFLINFIVAIVYLVKGPKHLYNWWGVLVGAALFLGFGIARSQALKAQDRVIRLEERLRYAAILAPDQAARAQALTVPQIIALRFASDAELPTLLDRALAEHLTPKQIKQAITRWRPDTLRV